MSCFRSALLSTQTALSSAKWWRRQARGAVTGYLLCMALAYVGQRALMYPAAPMTRPDFERAVSRLERASLLAPFDAIVLEPPPDIPVRATAVWFHGNGGLGWHRASVASEFGNRGVRLVLAEYPGYGPREGSRTEAAFVADGTALYTAVRARYSGTSLIVGESLGTAIASAVAAQAKAPPERLVLLTPLRNMPEAAARQFWMFPTEWLIKDRLDVQAHLRGYAGPVSMLVAGRDEVVGPEAGLALAKERRLREGAGLVVLERSTHNGWASYLDRKAWDQLLGSEVHRARPPA